MKEEAEKKIEQILTNRLQIYNNNKKLYEDSKKIILDIYTKFIEIKQLLLEYNIIKLKKQPKLPNFSPEEMRGLRRTFAMYVKFPKSRWKDIEKAEKFDDEGNKIWNELRQEYLDRFLNNPETAITEQGNSKEIESGEKNASGMGPSTGIGI